MLNKVLKLTKTNFLQLLLIILLDGEIRGLDAIYLVPIPFCSMTFMNHPYSIPFHY